MKTIFIFIVFLIGIQLDSYCQDIQNGKSIEITSDQRIRILVPGLIYRETRSGKLFPLEGVITEYSPNNIRFICSVNDSTYDLSLSEIERLEVYNGRKSYTLTGGGLGFLTGAVLGAAIKAHKCRDSRDDIDIVTPAIIGAAIGLPVGLIIGTLIKSDKWQKIQPDNIKITLSSNNNYRLIAGISIRF